MKPPTVSPLPPPALQRLQELKEILATLTDKERKVIDFVCVDGLQNKVIAHRMKCSVRSVEGYRAAAVSKFGAETMQQLATYYGEYRTLNLLNTTKVTAQ